MVKAENLLTREVLAEKAYFFYLKPPGQKLKLVAVCAGIDAAGDMESKILTEYQDFEIELEIQDAWGNIIDISAEECEDIDYELDF